MSKRVVDVYNTKNSELYHEFSGMKRVLAKVFVLWFEPSFFLQSEYPNNKVYHSALQIAVATCHKPLAVVSCFSCDQITRGKADNSAITRSHSSLSNLGISA